MIYVSHRMPEVFLRACAMRSAFCGMESMWGRCGKKLQEKTQAWPAGTQDQVVQMMIGRPVADYLPQYTANPSNKIVLQVKGLASAGKFEDVNFEVRAGEIVGFAGLVGAGAQPGARRRYLENWIGGRWARWCWMGKPLELGSILAVDRGRGIGLVPEDRKPPQGLVLMMGGRQNFSLPLAAGAAEPAGIFGIMATKNDWRRIFLGGCG